MGSVGEREQERAFQAWLDSYPHHDLGVGPGLNETYAFDAVQMLRDCWAAAEKRGQEPSCCHAHPGNGRLAVRERDD